MPERHWSEEYTPEQRREYTEIVNEAIFKYQKKRRQGQGGLPFKPGDTVASVDDPRGYCFGGLEEDGRALIWTQDRETEKIITKRVSPEKLFDVNEVDRIATRIKVQRDIDDITRRFRRPK